MNRQLEGFTPEAMNVLMERDWRDNNVRELESVIRRAAVTADGDTILAEHVDRQARVPDSHPPVSAVADPPSADPDTLPEHLSRLTYKDFKARVVDLYSRAYLLEVLRRSNGNISEAARLAGQERPNFKKLMRRFDVPSPHRGEDGWDDE